MKSSKKRHTYYVNWYDKSSNHKTDLWETYGQYKIDV